MTAHSRFRSWPTILCRLVPLICCAIHHAGATITYHPHRSDDGGGDWAFEAGVAFITSKNIEELVAGQINVGNGPAGGRIYHLTAARRLGEFEWALGDSTFRPQLEMPLTLKIVDENGRSPFLDYNISLAVRWVDFPWDEWVSTEFSMGLGISYSERIYLMDIQRHPGRERSRWKFNWPIQMTFASPDHPHHQLMLFLSHHSGGRIFDRGGVNSLGLGYRKSF